MKNKALKILSLVLACLMAFSVFPVAFAADAAETEENYPELTVKGFGASCVNIYYEDDPEKKSLFYPFDMDRLKKNLENIDQYLVSAIKNKEANMVSSIIYDYFMDCFGMLAYKPDGSMMDGVTSEEPGLRKKSDGVYEFYYDCREAPSVSSDYLHEAIEQLFAETGAEKIELIGSSFGANIVTAYMYEYDEYLDRIDTVLLCAPSVGGMHFIGELLSGNFDISAIGLCDLLDRLVEADVIPDFLYILEAVGVLDVLLGAFFVPVLEEAVYDAAVRITRDLLATLPTVWVTVPDEYFEEAMEFVYGKDYKDPNHTYARVIKEMTYYHNEIANNAAEIYLKAEENHPELNMAVVCKFGVAAIPLTSGENIMDDGLVTLPVSSFGATCTTYDAKLPANYKQKNYPEYNFMCPEWNIDASTCAFPFRTWFIKGLGHGKKIGDYNAFIREITRYDTDVFTDPNRPQYLKVSEENDQMLEPLTADETPKSFYKIVVDFFKKMLNFVKIILTRILGEKFLEGKFD